tara:strand:+ start:5818 stop:7677 length:1860 start_codon:yes stop_codon:yes gene_type:complete
MSFLPQKNRFSYIAVLFTVAVLITVHLRNNTWDNQPKANSFDWDNFGYYLYLPAIIESGDLHTLETTSNYFEAVKPSYSFYQVKYVDENPVIVYPMGLAMFYAPPYIATKAVMSVVYSDYSSFDRPFHIVISLWCFAFVIYSIFLLRKILLRYFKDSIVALSILILIFGTNTFFYQAYFPQIVHPILWGLYLVFLDLTIKWHEKQSIRNSILVGLTFSLCMLIRPSSFFLLIIFSLWGIHSIKDLPSRILWYLGKIKFLVVIAVSGFLLTIPQLLYWKMQTGDYFHFSYAVDWFDFSQPQIKNGFFGFRTGWAFHHPVVLLILVGLFTLFQKRNQYGLPILIATIAQVWFILSWSNYWYGSGFGHRGFTEYQALLVFPLASCINYSFRQIKIVKIMALSLFIGLALIGVLRVYQYSIGVWGMSNISEKYAKENYFALSAQTVNRDLLDPSWAGDDVLRQKLQEMPSKFVTHTVYKQDFEELGYLNETIYNEEQGQCFQLSPEVSFTPAYRSFYHILESRAGSGVELSCKINPTANNEGKKAYLVFEVMDVELKMRYYYSSIAIDFNQLEQFKWSTQSVIRDLPDIRFHDDIYSIYVYNPDGASFLVDDIELKSIAYQYP